jgi:hypothetical protein
MKAKAFTRTVTRELEDKWYQRAVEMANRYMLSYIKSNPKIYSQIVLDPQLREQYERVKSEVLNENK